MKIEEKKGKLVVTDFDEFEAYRIAVRIEKDGILLYGRLAASAQKPQVKETLEFLKKEETRHESIFERLLQERRDAGEDTSEDNDILSSMDFGVFEPYQSAEGLETALNDMDKALRLGLAIEEKSIVFYQACKNKISSAKTAAELKRIIEEEKRHKALLEEMLKQRR